MHVIITCKHEKDRMKNSREKVPTSIFRRSRAGNSVIRGRIWPNFELIHALMYVFVTCTYEKDPIKTAEKKWQHHYKSMGIFSDAKWQQTPQSVVESRRIS